MKKRLTISVCAYSMFCHHSFCFFFTRFYLCLYNYYTPLSLFTLAWENFALVNIVSLKVKSCLVFNFEKFWLQPTYLVLSDSWKALILIHWLAEIFTASFWAAVGCSQPVFGPSTRWDLIFDLIKMRQRSIFNHTLDCLRPAYTTSVISTYPLYTALKMGIFTKI